MNAFGRYFWFWECLFSVLLPEIERKMKHLFLFGVLLWSVVACRPEPEIDVPSGEAGELYVAGLGALDSGKVERAMLHFLVVEHEAQADEDFRLSYQAAMESGRIAERFYLETMARETYLRALEYAVKLDDKADLAAAELAVGRIYALDDAWNLAVPYLDRAIKIFRAEAGQEAGLCEALAARTLASVAQGEWDLVGEYLQEIDSIPAVYRQVCEPEIALGKAYYYDKKEEYDLSEEAAACATKSKKWHIQRAAYEQMSHLEELKENYAMAVQHMEAARICQDSVLHNPQAREVCVLPALYEYELVQDNIVREKWIIYTLLTILWGFTLFYACHTFRLWRQMKRREWTLKYMHEVVYNLRRKLDQNDAEVEKYRDLYDSVSASSVEEKKILEEHLQQVVLESSWWTARSSKITTDFSDWLRKIQDDKNFKDESPLYTWFLLFRLKRKPAYIHDEDWEELYLTMDLLFDNFTKRLKAAYPDITESDLQYCCLFKAGFSIRQVAVMMGVAPTSVSRKKLKIREHMHLDKKMDVEKVCKKF